MSGKQIKYTKQFDKDLNELKALINPKDMKVKYSDANILYNIFDKNKDGMFDLNEMENFFNCLRDGNSAKTEFEIDDECIDKFIASIPKKELKDKNITKNDVLNMVCSLSNCIYNKYTSFENINENLLLDENLENNLTNLKTEISFDTNDEVFKNILKIFDVDENKGKLSPDEIKNLYKEINANLTTTKNKKKYFDENKIQNYLQAHSADKNISVEDFLSFVETINLATQNRDSDNNVDWSALNISEPNLNIEGDGNVLQNTGDCYLTGVLLGTSMSSIGRKILSDLIKKDDKGNIYVHLKGAKETYVITPEDFENSGTSRLSGDGDLRAIELAFEKHRKLRNVNLNRGDSRIAMFLITGIDTQSSFGPKYLPKYATQEDIEKSKRNYSESSLDNIDTEKNCVVSSAFDKLADMKTKTRNGKLVKYYDNVGFRKSIDGQQESVPIEVDHTYVVRRTEGDKIYLLETNSTNGQPLDDAEIEISKKDFYKYFNNLSFFDLTQS